jgi:hypothetical protein
MDRACTRRLHPGPARYRLRRDLRSRCEAPVANAPSRAGFAVFSISIEDQIGRDEKAGDAGKNPVTLRAKAWYALRFFRVRGGGIALRIRLSFRAKGLQRSFNPSGAAQWTLKL